MTRILIIDDTSEIREVIRLLLETEGYEISEAASGKEGLEISEKFRPNLILLDHHMPNMSGITMLRMYRKQERRIPVIILTADMSQSLAVQAFRDGADDFLQKPFDPDFLKIVVHRTIEARENRRRLCESETARKAAEKANQMKSKFLSNMQHETATPIHHILSYVGLAKRGIAKGKPQEKILEDLSNAEEDGKRLMTYIRRISELSKLESGDDNIVCKDESLKRIVSLTTSTLTPKAKAKNIQIDTKIPEKLIVQMDTSRIGQTLTELLDNAIQFSPENSTVHVTVKMKDEMVCISVVDAGVGVPKNETESIFHPFTQSSRTDDGSGGTGLGLAIAKRIILNHGGKIRVENRTEGGSIFTFTLPIVQNNQKKED